VWWAHKVREYIDRHITDRILAADLGVLAGLGKAHFTRTFKRAFGVPPHAFVLRRRLELAARYMLETEAPLSAIALQCGFTDQAHLGNRFREATGLSPAAWRRLRGAQESYRFSIELASE
jgi:AraC-like DNA-binding protein